MDSSRRAVTSAFFWRSEPAAALRGLTATGWGLRPASMRTLFSSCWVAWRRSNAVRDR